MTQRTHPNRFPGETSQYRAARNKLLKAERDLRRRVERVDEILTGKIFEDYVFEQGATGLDDPHTVHSVKFSELFRDGLNTLLVYSFMFGQEMKQACPMCTSFSRHPSTSDWTEEGQINEGRPRCAQDKHYSFSLTPVNTKGGKFL